MTRLALWDLRTDCHFSVSHEDFNQNTNEYSEAMTKLVSGADGLAARCSSCAAALLVVVVVIVGSFLLFSLQLFFCFSCP